MDPFSFLMTGLACLGAITIFTSLKVLREYERAIVFRFGRARPKPLGPGIVLMLPLGIDRAMVVDTRTKVIQIPAQEVITFDNISISVDAIVYADVASPQAAILKVENYMPATLQLAATTLRSVLGKMELDDILAKRSEINLEIQSIMDARTEQWGVEITAIEIKDITLPENMKRVIARQAEAERERRAKVINAEGELQSAEKLAQAAQLLSASPGALQLRLYQTLVEVSSERNNTIVMPLPIELLQQGGAAATSHIQSTTAMALASNAARDSNAAARTLGPGKSNDEIDRLLNRDENKVPTK